MANRKWTSREDAEIRKEIRKNPQNLSKCFATLAVKLNRTEASVQHRYYTSVRLDSKHPLFYTVSSKKAVVNTKSTSNSSNNFIVVLSKTWTAIKRLLK